MTIATRRRSGRWLAPLGLLLFIGARPAHALTLDDRGEMRLGMRVYTSVRIGTETMGGEDNPLTFPHSGAGHVRQNRYFLELKLDHDIRRLATETKGAAWLLGWFNPSRLSYSLQYRGEGEGIYDFGPQEFSDQGDALRRVRLQIPPTTKGTPLETLVHTTNILDPRLINQRISKLRRIARQRHRFFLGYMDVEKGPVFFRVGRQILAWGETDIFRLLDNINPLDDSFGGFFIALDERRLPLDMVRGSYQIGSVGPVHDAFFEGFVASGHRVSTFPGIPPGSPWEPGGLGFPNPALRTVADIPDTTDVRGGARPALHSHDATYRPPAYAPYPDLP